MTTTSERVYRRDGNGNWGWVTEEPSGGSQPITREQITGNVVHIVNGGIGFVTFDTPSGDHPLVDLTSPANPAVVAAGTYAVAVTVASNLAMTAGGSFVLSLSLDATGEGAITTTAVPAIASNGNAAEGSLTLVYYIPLAGTITARVINYDGVQDLDFILTASVIQRLS